MPASFPTAVKTFINRNAGDVIQPAHVNDLQDEVAAMEAGYLTGTAPLVSSHVSAAAGLSVVGNSTLASTITIGTVPYVFPVAAPTAGNFLVCASTGAVNTLSWTGGANAMTLLKSGNGTSTAAGATTLDTVVLSTALTANDRIIVEFDLTSSSQTTANPQLYHVTDGAGIMIFNGTPAAGTNLIGEARLTRSQGSATALHCKQNGVTSAGPAAMSNYAAYGATATWNSGWTLGLRHAGVTAGGTFIWQWSVYLLAGQ